MSHFESVPPRPSTTRLSTDRLTRLLRPRLLRMLDSLEGGTLTVLEGHECQMLGKGGPRNVTLRINDSRAWRRMALGGTVAAAEAYMDGQWEADDLVGLIRLFAFNLEQVNSSVDSGTSRFSKWALSVAYALARNTLQGSKRNISAHYDLGNNLFTLFLDNEHRMYSSAVFPHPEASLEEASAHKLERLFDMLELGPDHHLLEIGTGWGGLALHAAKTRGCRVTTTTISDEQHAYTAKRIAEEGLGDRITLLKQDYRALEGRFDRIVSVEMIEAVGHQYLPTYLKTLERLLTHDGLIALQAITIRDQRFAAARREMDFIKRYIFPGGFLPSHGAILTAMQRDTQLNLLQLEDIGLHYAATLKAWGERFESRLGEVYAQGYDERFVRMWRYYLAYCEGGFRERTIGTCQLLMGGPGARPAQVGLTDWNA
ncbi:cyclopropane-fatty-acyl-phospholipid synthase family protein [Cobetia sp. QF-1]|uniref:SAM-dependent methyltransferase n=1 Tax=Cobetia sp. QF-1 TaxID=1969833 RepID=UPI000B542B6C|nr:cyclopropane-fatty-acyl-phospholipid synthase family protein [Cobetia sp. QF-1]